MNCLAESVGEIAASTGFSGVLRVDRGDDSSFARAYGLAHRGHRIANTVDTRFGIASGTKGVTAVTVMTLVERGELDLTTTGPLGTGRRSAANRRQCERRASLGAPVRHRRLRRRGGGRGSTDYVLPVPVHRLARTEEYVGVLAGHRQVSAPGERFSYNNSGFVVLALIAERISGIPFERLVQERVCVPGGMSETAFLRSDEPTGCVALGYLDGHGLRTNVLHLPLLGSGDGGLYSTAADVCGFWVALFSGRIVSLSCYRGDGATAKSTCRRSQCGMAWGSGSIPPAALSCSRGPTRACLFVPSMTRLLG